MLPQHEDYSVIGRITPSLSTAFVHFCAQGATTFALPCEPPFTADYPEPRSTVEFR
jgi:hypothetical protein